MAANNIDTVPPVPIGEHHLWRDWFTLLRTKVLTSRANDVPSAITPGASPYVYQNTGSSPVSVLVSGGTVSAIDFSRDGSTYYNVGVVAGMFELSSGDYLKTTYTGVPTMTLIPR